MAIICKASWPYISVCLLIDAADELHGAASIPILSQLHRWANGVVDSRAPSAPDVARDEAIIQLAGYLFDKPPASRSASYANAWEFSGSANILRPWTRRRGIVLE